jgi:putative tryptophan/tyrosine transport system substrate-binding protein
VKRRTFIAGLGGAAAWPLVVHGQQQTIKVWRVGYLSPGTSDKNALGVAMSEALRLKLQDLGYIEGKNLKLDVRRAEQNYARLPALAIELVSLAPDVTVGSFDPATAALQRATSSIPICSRRSFRPSSSSEAFEKWPRLRKLAVKKACAEARSLKD